MVYNFCTADLHIRLISAVCRAHRTPLFRDNAGMGKWRLALKIHLVYFIWPYFLIPALGQFNYSISLVKVQFLLFGNYSFNPVVWSLHAKAKLKQTWRACSTATPSFFILLISPTVMHVWLVTISCRIDHKFIIAIDSKKEAKDHILIYSHGFNLSTTIFVSYEFVNNP